MWKGDQEQALIASSALWMKHKTHRHLHTHRHTLLRKSRRRTSRAIWITNTPAICRTTECSQPFRHISQQSFGSGSPRTTWCISNALLSGAAQFKCAAWWEVCFWRWNFPFAADLTLSSPVACGGRCSTRSLRQCFVLSRPIRAE